MREDFVPWTTIPPERWGRDHWATLAYAFTRAGRTMDLQKLRTGPGSEIQHPTRLQGGVDLYGHDDIDCLRDAVAAHVLRSWGTDTSPRASFTPQGLVLGQWLVSALEDRRVTTTTLTWSDALALSGAEVFRV